MTASWKRLSVALVVVLSGLLLAPYVALPNESFSWRMFAGAYGVEPVVSVDFTTGAPGSYFTITGFNFPAGKIVKVKVNGRELASLTTSDTGSFTVVFNSATSGIGTYDVEVEVEDRIRAAALADQRDASFTVLVGAPLRARPATTGALVDLPSGLARSYLYLPQVAK